MSKTNLVHTSRDGDQFHYLWAARRCLLLISPTAALKYRNVSGYRHRHKDALVQIANELAAKGLCHPLIPSPYAPASYVKEMTNGMGECNMR